MRVTVRGNQCAKRNKAEAVCSIVQWSKPGEAVVQGSYEMTTSTLPATGAPDAAHLQIAIEENRFEPKFEASPGDNRAFEWSFV